MSAPRKPRIRGKQIASVFCPCCAALFIGAEQLGDAEIIPASDFPRGAPTVDDKGRRAYFGVRCSRRVMRVADRAHAAARRGAA